MAEYRDFSLEIVQERYMWLKRSEPKKLRGKQGEKYFLIQILEDYFLVYLICREQVCKNMKNIFIEWNPRGVKRLWI